MTRNWSDGGGCSTPGEDGMAGIRFDAWEIRVGDYRVYERTVPTF